MQNSIIAYVCKLFHLLDATLINFFNTFVIQVEATDCAADDSQTPDQMVDCMLQKSTDELVYASLSVYVSYYVQFGVRLTKYI